MFCLTRRQADRITLMFGICVFMPQMALLELLIGFYHAFAFAAIANLTALCGTRPESRIDFRYVSAPDASLHLQNQLEIRRRQRSTVPVGRRSL